MSFLKDIWDNRFQRYLILSLVLLWIVLLLVQRPPVADTSGDLHFFYHPTCPHCQAEEPFLEALETEQGVTFTRHDTSQPEEIVILREKAAALNVSQEQLGVPVTIIGKRVFIGYSEQIGEEIRNALEAYKTGEPSITGKGEFQRIVSLPLIGEVDVLNYSLPVLAVILGLIDGFNPCAMWVLVYLISIIIGLGDKRRIWLLVGSFVAASGILYFLFMTAWLNAFLFIGYLRPVTLAIGLAALAFGILNLKEFIETKGPLVCDIGDASSKRRTMQRIDKLVASPLTWATILGIIALAFVVNSIEFACSAALPAIFAQVLALSGVSALQHYLYIALYVFFFMLDDLIIFGLAAFAVSTSFGDRYAKVCKLVGGILLLVIGVLLTFAPHLLR